MKRYKTYIDAAKNNKKIMDILSNYYITPDKRCANLLLHISLDDGIRIYENYSYTYYLSNKVILEDIEDRCKYYILTFDEYNKIMDDDSWYGLIRK